MSKKQKAFKLFDQGKKPRDQEIKSLGLKSKSTYNYYQEWKKLGVVIVAEEEGQHSALSSVSNNSSAVLMKLQPQVVICPLTPIMMSARYVAERELGWRADMPWENFIDTCLYHLFKTRGFTLQGYIVDDTVEAQENSQGTQLKVGSGFDQEKLALAIAQALMNLSQQS